MAKSTGVILAIGGVTIANRVIFNDEDMDWRIAVGTGLAAITFAGLEKANEQLAVGLAYVALVAVLLTRLDPKVPAPTESALRWWNTPAGASPKKSSTSNTSTSKGVFAA